MDRTGHLLLICAEECAEVAHRVSKALRFGIEEIQPEQNLTNAQRIMQEYADLYAVIDMLCDEGVLEIDSTFATMVVSKKEKVENFLKYSVQCGRLVGRRQI
jgi:hypothetical protein